MVFVVFCIEFRWWLFVAAVFSGPFYMQEDSNSAVALYGLPVDKTFFLVMVNPTFGHNGWEPAAAFFLPKRNFFTMNKFLLPLNVHREFFLSVGRCHAVPVPVYGVSWRTFSLTFVRWEHLVRSPRIGGIDCRTARRPRASWTSIFLSRADAFPVQFTRPFFCFVDRN